MFYKLIKVGNSIGITLPKKLLDLMDLEQGEDVMIEPNMDNRTIVIKPVSVAKQQVKKSVIEGTAQFIKRYPKALKNLAGK